MLDGQERATGMDESKESDERSSPAAWMMVQLGGPLAEALVRIRAHAYATDRSLSEVAADIVARRFSFDIDSGPA